MIIPLLPLLLTVATASPPEPRGVWRGTLGKQPIVACFDEYFGGYYYESRRHDIPLEGSDDGSLAEKPDGEEATGTWRIAALVPEFIADWSSPDGKRALPIRMKPIAKLGAEQSCFDSAAYNEPRLAHAPLAPAVVGTEQGLVVRREKVRDAEVERVQLDLAGPAGERINANLAKEFRELLGLAYTCMSSSESSLAFADARWVVVKESADMFCHGAAHGEDFVRVLVFDRASGRRIDTSAWLAEGDALPALLAKKAKPEADCIDAWGAASNLQVWPSAGGLSFRPEFPHVASVCEADVEISLEQAAPYLSEAAKRVLAPEP